jgi:hypothetical protein
MKYTTNYNIPKPEDNNIDVFNVETLHTILDSIDSLTKMVENINAQIPQTNATAEVIEARGTFSTLDGRIDDVETKAATASTDASSAVGDVTAHTGNGTIHVVKDGTLQTGLNAEKVGGKKITEIGSALILANNAHTSTDLPSTYPLGISMFWLPYMQRGKGDM